eukprot:1161782-Pelagomonas_calceolata.AAC.20
MVKPQAVTEQWHKGSSVYTGEAGKCTVFHMHAQSPTFVSLDLNIWTALQQQDLDSEHRAMRHV